MICYHVTTSVAIARIPGFTMMAPLLLPLWSPYLLTSTLRALSANSRLWILLSVLFLLHSSVAHAMSVKSPSVKMNAASLRDVVLEAAERDEDSSLDLSGILFTEHINLVVGDRSTAEYFYLDFLGCSKDRSKSFHVNMGQQQFHLAPGDKPQAIAGSIGLTVPSLDTIRSRLSEAQEVLKDSQFDVLQDTPNSMTLSCPWGNLFHLYSLTNDCMEDSTVVSTRKMEVMHAKHAQYGSNRMAVRGNPGIRYIEFRCSNPSTVAHFYRTMVGCTVHEMSNQDTPVAVVCVGPGIHLVFVEANVSPQEASRQQGVHVCFYAADFENLYHRLAERNLIWTNPRFVHLDSCDTWEEARTSRTLRFKDIVDLQTNQPIMELEHETRPLRHGQYLKVPFYEPR